LVAANVVAPFDNAFTVRVRRAAFGFPSVARIRTGGRDTTAEGVRFSTDVEAQAEIAAVRTAEVAL
jgi:hypothetical protein